jgi:hypothetical protein
MIHVSLEEPYQSPTGSSMNWYRSSPIRNFEFALLYFEPPLDGVKEAIAAAGAIGSEIGFPTRNSSAEQAEKAKQFHVPSTISYGWS